MGLDLEKLACTVRGIRCERRLTRLHLGFVSGLGAGTIALIEKESYADVSLAEVFAIAEALDVTVADLLGLPVYRPKLQ